MPQSLTMNQQAFNQFSADSCYKLSALQPKRIDDFNGWLR